MLSKKKDESFVGNIKFNGGKLPSRILHLRSVRMGEQAVDIHGKDLARDYMRPLFIGKEDLNEYDRIMCDKRPF